VADAAVIGYVHGGTVRAEFCASLLAACMEGATPVPQVLAVGSGPNISHARNVVCRQFLEQDAADWLFMCDTDMWFPADTVSRLVAAADPAERPVVGALCFSQNTDNGGGEPYPTMYELTERDGDLAFIRYKRWPEDAVMRVSGTGAAALLIHRRALEAVEKRAGDVVAPWFRESQTKTALMGEDLTFCLRCAAAGVPVHVHTGVRVGHMKTTMLI
jgi:GT2 family glycosyltransferase